jgi:hypothetical protein
MKQSNFLEAKKELAAKISACCVEYNKYVKSKPYKEIADIINTELKPLEQLIMSCTSLDFFEERKKKGEEVQEFRLTAAREVFIKSMDNICKILFTCKELERDFDCARMLERFEIPNWKNIRPYEYFLSILQKNYNAFREQLKTMYKQGKSISK